MKFILTFAWAPDKTAQDEGIRRFLKTGGLPPEGAKGLEFDSVLVVDPAAIVAEGVRGWNDLYVVLTRATQRLGVLHPGELPTELSGLEQRS